MSFKDKSPEVQDFLDIVSEGLMGMKASEALQNNLCVSCHHPAGEFRDPLSAKEYNISGLCQTCQDSIFGDPSE